MYTRPVWSPDSKSIAYARQAARGWTTFSQAVNGSSGPQLVDQTFDGVSTSWSPDGKFIAVTATGEGTLAREEIWILPLSGDRKPFPFIQGSSGNRDGQFAPDGRWFLYTSDEAGHIRFYVVPFPGPGGKWEIPAEGGAGFAARCEVNKRAANHNGI